MRLETLCGSCDADVSTDCRTRERPLFNDPTMDSKDTAVNDVNTRPPPSAESQDGNAYVLATTGQGTPTFRHVATGEALHGQVGPYEEAWKLYVGESKLLERSGHQVIFDVGMGCASPVFAALDALARNPRLTGLTFVSFDLEKNGLEALKRRIDLFPFVERHADVLERMTASDAFDLELPSGQRVDWRFVGGDFKKTIASPAGSYPAADLIFYDFFSPASHPALWTHAVFSHVHAHSSDRAVLITYSSASSVRAALAGAGFYVGLGEPSGKKAPSTIAARRIDDLADPLPPRWKKTFLASHKAFSEAESEASRARITEAILAHPQFASCEI